MAAKKKTAVAKKSRKGIGGQPTKYKPEYCGKLIEFFSRNAPYREEADIYTYKDGSTKESYKEVPEDLPMFCAFATSIKVHVDTLHEWKKTHREFSEAYTRAKQIQENHLVQNALRGNYNANFSIFFAKNNLGYVDRMHVTEEQAADYGEIEDDAPKPSAEEARKAVEEQD